VLAPHSYGRKPEAESLHREADGASAGKALAAGISPSALTTEKAPSRAFPNERYWARTSEAQLVESRHASLAFRPVPQPSDVERALIGRVCRHSAKLKGRVTSLPLETVGVDERALEDCPKPKRTGKPRIIPATLLVLSRRWKGAQLRPLPLPADYGNVGSAYDPPKMSVLPNVAGQTLFGAGAVGSVVDVPVRKLYNAWR
jgi:hypothetical protein